MIDDLLIGAACAWSTGFIFIVAMSYRKHRRNRRRAQALMIDHLRRIG